MRSSHTVRAIVLVTALAVVIGGAPLTRAADEPSGRPEAGVDDSPDLTLLQQQEPIEAAEDLTGDIEFSVPGGTFQGQMSVSLSTSVAGAEIRYRTDGGLPDASSPVFNGTPLQFTRSTQLRAQPFVAGQPAGDPGTAVYVAQQVTTNHDLPVLVIDSYGEGTPDREYFDGATMLFEPTNGVTSLAGDPAFATRAGFRLRGQSSASFEKTPYRLEFWDNEDDDADYPVLGMPADGDWVLRGPFTDKALIRDAFVYDLGRDMNLYAPRFEFVEFYLNPDSGPVTNADYMGVYMIVEKIENRSHRLDLKRLRGDRPEDRTLPRLTGAYIWKFDWMAAEEPILPCSGSPGQCWNYLELDDPHPTNDLQPEQRAWITNHLQEFNDMLHGPGFADPETGYRAWIDVPSWVDNMIINELSREMDAYVRSAYFYKDRAEPITAGPLWDFDLSFGVGGFFQNTQAAGWQWQQTRQPIANNWYPRLMQDPAFVDDVRRRWAELRGNGGLLSDAALQARIDALANPLTNAAQRNFQRWPNLTSPQVSFFQTPTAPTWQGQVTFMRDWMFQRAEWLDSPAGWNVGTVPPPPPPGPPPPPPPPGPPPPPPPPPGPPPPPPPPPPGPPPPPPPPPPPGSGCTATYVVTNEWQSGFQADVQVTAGSAPISGWTVTWTFTAGQSVQQAWNAQLTGGPTVTATNESWNGNVAAGASTGFGFLASWSGTNPVPTLTCTAS